MTKAELLRIKQNTLQEKKQLERARKDLYEKQVGDTTLYVYIRARTKTVKDKMKMIRELEGVL